MKVSRVGDTIRIESKYFIYSSVGTISELELLGKVPSIRVIKVFIKELNKCYDRLEG